MIRDDALHQVLPSLCLSRGEGGRERGGLLFVGLAMFTINSVASKGV